MTIQRRMFLGLVSVVVVFVVAVNFIVQHLLVDIAEREILIELENAVVAYHRFDEQRQELLVTRALSIAQTVHLVATLAIPDVDVETVRVAGEYLEGVSNIELLLIMSDTGELIVDVNGLESGVNKVDFGPGLQRALAGETYFGLWNHGNGLYQVAVAPVISNYQVLGLVATGQRIDSPAAIRLAEEISGVSVLWSHGEKDFSLSAGELVRHVENAPLEKLIVNGELVLKATISYTNFNAALVFHKKMDLAASGVATMRSFVLICSAVAILLGMGLCFRIASQISGPITRLTKATTKFGEGNFDIRLEPESKDEIGALTKAFNEMADEIVIKRQKLLASLDAAEAANRAKSEFLARMSHEIRTPMNGVLGMAELLLISGLNEQQREYALTILDSSDGLMSIINDVLDFSKIEAGGLELNVAPFDVYEAVAATADLLVHHAENKGLKLVLPPPSDESLWVQGDKLRFRQVLTNLIGNAVKFTEQGQVTVRVDAAVNDDNNVTLRIDVTDTGVGIAPEDLERAFNSFTQVDGSATRRFGGTGLGLSICKQLAELMGGQIGAHSEINIGSTFWFQVTMRQAEDQTASLQLVGASQSALLNNVDLRGTLSMRIVQPLRSPAKILLAEDNAANQMVAVTMLRMLGCEIDIVEDGRKALTKAKSQTYDIILMDCQMPNMDGFSATGAIRDWEEKQNVATPTPIIALTANALVTDRERCLAAGMSDYISKPFRLADLREGIERWLPDERSMAVVSPTLDTPSIGKSELDELRELGASSAELEEIVACYVETSAASIEEMAIAIKSRNREALRKLAHKLKGGSGQVGAHTVANFCLQLEGDSSNACWKTLAAQLAGLTQEINAANEELRTLYQRLSA